MKVVIEIPEAFEGHFNQDRFKDSFERILEDCKHSAILSGIYEFETIEMLIKAFENGAPLPKGHGRLIDVNDLLDDINLEDNNYNRDVNTGEIITLENIDRIPTIIEADGGEEDEADGS